ncbi:MAG: polyprenyl synthetase family protein [Tissierellia bacterium]|nr:polyprenyl synthetase family protein [Tissierellia bacterium]
MEFHPLYYKLKEKIDREIRAMETEDTPLRKILHYAVDDGGKRIRPVLLLFFAKDDEKAMDFALALEMIHNYSLIHDDLPCMDDDDYRRGKASVHKQFGEAMAVLSGDALLNKAYELIFRNILQTKGENKDKVRAGELISRCAGIDGMIHGQELDINENNHPIEMIYYKTCNLFIGACGAGAILQGASEEEIKDALDFGKYYGYLFQLTDDLEDFEDDQKAGKKTFVTMKGKESTTEMIALFQEKAMEIAEKEDTGFLKNLIQITVDRG